MSEDQKKQLEQQLWNIANTLRGKMDADEFRDYILGFIFYKYLSEKMHLYANEILKEDGVKYEDIKEDTKDGAAYLGAIKEEALIKLGYFLKPSELFSEVAKRGNADAEDDEAAVKSNFILEDLAKILNSIEQSTMGTDSEDEFDNLFEDLDLTSTKLGRTESAKNALISKVLAHLNKIDFKLEDANSDVLGDAYEYLIGKFASGAGKKAGEFYTPQEVSKVLAKLVTTGKSKLKSVYDPTCGSGSLLLRVAKEVTEVGKFYGQELNRTTYNLARMNMILHDVHYRRFDIRQEDTLEQPQHINERFEAIVANPPFSAKWSSSQLYMSDDRFSQYGRLAPAGKADLAFVQHMIHHLSDNGTMAVLVPHGVLFREGAEGHIRQFLIEEKNYLDAVIGLPANIFYGTGIPTCILVFKKCREQPSNILFIDASKEYGNAVNQNYLRPEDIDRIIATYRQRVAVEKYSYVAKMDEVSENQFNLNIPRYVRSTKNEEIINLKYIAKSLSDYEEKINGIEKIINEFCSELKLPEPNGNNLYYLHQYKKGVIQQLLNQEIRFKNDFGNEFEEWEEKKLIDIAVHITKKNKSNDVTFVLTNSATKGIVSQQDFFDKDIANQNNLFGYYIVEKDDFVYNPRISNNAPVGPVKRNHFGLGVMSPLYTVFRFKDNDLRFFEYYFETTNWHQYLQSVANYGARHDRMNITNSNFFKMLIPVPSQPEQKKIADFLAAIDYKIVCISQGL